MIPFNFAKAHVRRFIVTTIVGASALALVLLAAQTPRPGPATPTIVAPAEQPLRSVNVTAKDIALTFDISWGTVMPPKVLHILVSEHVPSTFFLSGPWVTKHPEFVREIAKDGFQIESHGQAHVNYSGLSNAQVRSNMEAAHAAIKSVTGISPKYIRPPNGDYNKRTLAVAASLGYRVVIWDTDSLDWMNPGVNRIVGRVVKRAHPGDIILMHASDTCKQTDKALPTIIKELRAKGFHFLTLNTLLERGTSTNGESGY